MQTILITGFGRFTGSPVDPSGLIATRLAQRRRPGLRWHAGHRPCLRRYDAVDRDLPALVSQENPDILVIFAAATRACQAVKAAVKPPRRRPRRSFRRGEG
jgi:pyroglutamyl-peptidase